MKFEFIRAEQAHFSIRLLCRWLQVARYSDQGCTYASEDYPRGLQQHGLRCSMCRRGNCYDNAAMESWFSTLKNELGGSFQSASDAKVKLFDDIEVFYNQQRMHSAIGYVAPAEFGRAAA